MIHRESRNRLAEALRHYAAGRITNDDLDSVEIDWRDRGAIAVNEMAWGLYDDHDVHKATGRHQLDRDARRAISKWIVFLHSDCEYIWPEYSFLQFVNWPMNILTFGWWERNKQKKWEEFLEAGDFEAWPFRTKQELDNAIGNPKLLANKIT